MIQWRIEKARGDVEPMPVASRRGILPERGFGSVTPANHYTDGLRAAANGIAMFVYGQPYDERIVLTHEDLYGNAYPFELQTPDLRRILPEVRRLLAEGKSAEANRLAIAEAEKQGYAGLSASDMPFDASFSHPACQLRLSLPRGAETKQYLRTLDFDSGEAAVTYENERGVYRRYALANGAKRVYAVKIENPDRETPVRLALCTDDEDGHKWERLSFPAGMTTERAVCGGCLLLYCKYDSATMGQRGYGVLLRAATDGAARLTDAEMTIDGATTAQLFLKAVTLENASLAALRREAEAFEQTPLTYAACLAENRALLTEPMERSRLRLRPADDDEPLLAVEELLARQHTGDGSPLLAEHMYDMGRYFLLTETGRFPPQMGQYNINVNLQLCAGNATGLWEQMHVFFGFIESQWADYQENAERIFGCRGVMIPIHPNPDHGRATHFSYSWPHQYWIACAAWVYNEFWNHYLVTGDTDFLREHVLPGLEQIALFFEDYLRADSARGELTFSPGMSPECTPKGEGYSSLMQNTTMDVMACAEALTNLLTACDTLGLEHPKRALWESMLARLPALRLDAEGDLKEWALPDVPEDYNHRCVSHHYALWPAHMVTWERTPELARAIRISNRKRAQENDSAHGIVHRLFCAIRLRDLPDVEHNLRQLLEHGYIRNSLMTNHYPYAVYFPDITGSFPAFMAEMLAFSEPGCVELLPALPRVYAAGSLTGLRLYCFAEAEYLAWNLDEGTICLRLRSLREQTLTLRCRQGMRWLRIDDGAWTAFDTQTELQLNANEPLTLALRSTPEKQTGDEPHEHGI